MRHTIALSLVLFALSASLVAQSASPSLDASSIFLEAPEYSTGAPYAQQIAVADFNRDGIPDAVVANSCNGCANGTVGVLLGIGGGTFQAAVLYNTGGTAPYAVAVDDVNGDGNADVVVSNRFSGTVAVLMGNGDGTFQAAQTYSSGGYDTTSIAIADVNGDGKPDLVMANFCVSSSSCGNPSGSVAVLLGNGDGTFQPAVTYNTGGSSIAVVVSDVNGDGKPDLVVADNCSVVDQNGCVWASVGVLLGNGDGTFQPVMTFRSSADALSLAVRDVNGDGKPDIVVATGSNVELFPGNGDGTFQSPVSIESAPYITDHLDFVSLADVNGDGKLDMLLVEDFSSACCGGSLLVMLGNGDGTFQPATAFSSVGALPLFFVVADVNADGKPDVLITNECASYTTAGACTTGTLTVLLGNGDGTFRGARNYNAMGPPPPYQVAAIAAGDLNGDAKADLVVAYDCVDIYVSYPCKGAVDVLMNNGDGTFGAPSTTFVTVATAVAVADVNGDGKPDLAVGSGCTLGISVCPGLNLPTGSISVLLGNGDGTFASAGFPYPTSGIVVTAVAVADVNGDGKPDLLIANSCEVANCADGFIYVLLGKGDGTFQSPASYDAGGVNSQSLAVSDVNGDGHPDLIVANSGCNPETGNCGLSAGVSVLLGNGDGTFQPAVIYATGGQVPVTVAVGDINGDGKPDIVIGNSDCNTTDDCTNANVAVLLGNGDGTFQSPLTNPVPGSHAMSLVLADFSSDGKLNVAGASSLDFVLIGNGDGTFQPSVSLGIATPGVVAADLTGQGKPSLVFAGGVTVLLNTISKSPAATSVSLASSANPSSYGQNIFLTASVASVAPGLPTGNVSFSDGANSIGVAALASGAATLNISNLSIGSHNITASYSGDSKFQPSTAAALNQNVIQPVVTFSGSPQQPLTTDGSGNFVAQVTITNTGNVTVNSIQVTSATLGSGALLSAPAAITNLPPGAGAVVTLTFPPNSVPSGATTAPLKLNGAYSVTSPALNGNWALSFRSVTL